MGYLGRGNIERDVRRMLPFLQLTWAAVDAEGNTEMHPAGGKLYMGLPLGPAIELVEIEDENDDGTPYLDAGGEAQVRYAVRLVGRNGVAGVVLLSGTRAQPAKAALLLKSPAPTSASDLGTEGEIRVDANYVYVCTATNVWKRAALSSW